MKIGIALLAYCRPNHLEKVLMSIKREKIKEITVYIDGPVNNEIKLKQKIILKKIEKFRNKIKIKIVSQSKNNGLAFSVTNAVSSELKNNDAVILLEDDCVLLKGFFNYMKRSLIKYRYFKNVKSICSYNNLNSNSDNCFFIKRFNPWAWATWKDRWKQYNPDIKKVVNHLDNSGLAENLPLDLKSLCKNSDIIDGKQDIWSLSWTLGHYMDNALALYPPKSFVKNIGFDGSGVHCIKTKVFKINSTNSNKISFPKNIKLDFQKEIQYNLFLIENSSKTFFKQKKTNAVEPFRLLFKKKFILKDQLKFYIERIANSIPIIDIHTHLFPSNFKKFYKSGIVELLNYHYLIAELFSSSKINISNFNKLNNIKKASIVWDNLFLKNHPYSTATKGILKILQTYDVKDTKISFKKILEITKKNQISELDIFKISNVEKVVMTNNPFDEEEFKIIKNFKNSRYLPSIRIDDIFSKNFNFKGISYSDDQNINKKLDNILISFFENIINQVRPVYLALSSNNFDEFKNKHFFDSFFKMMRKKNLPLMLLIGVKRGVNPTFGLAGDGLSNLNLDNLEKILSTYSKNKFLVTCLDYKDQFRLSVIGRKFQNLKIFGIWWFNNNPSLINQIFNQRLELLGDNFIFQHSDSRVTDQLIYKWYDFKNIYINVISNKYQELSNLGYRITITQLEKNIESHFKTNPSKILRLKC